jgi:aminomethyltransferase
VAHQEDINQSLARTLLYQLSAELKARFTSFGGWEMPVQFAGIS